MNAPLNAFAPTARQVAVDRPEPHTEDAHTEDAHTEDARAEGVAAPAPASGLTRGSIPTALAPVIQRKIEHYYGGAPVRPIDTSEFIRAREPWFPPLASELPRPARSLDGIAARLREIARVS